MDPQSSSNNIPANGGEREIYIAAVKISSLSERDAFLKQACDGRDELRHRIEKLIAAKERGNANLSQSAVTPSAALETPADDDTGGTIRNVSPQTQLDVLASKIDIAERPVIGRYQLLEEIGQGGMGTVYRAQQSEPVRRSVAVKVINPGMNSREVLIRFEAERQTLAMMDHPNIASVFDGGTTESGFPYFVMELVRGIPITEYCRQHDLGLRDRISLFIDLCRAVHHAHQRGIIHRDLKPSNILVADHDDRPIIKVIDFGVAKALRGQLADRTLLTQASQLLGTPIYMSPEQAIRRDMDVDTRSDVYSLGVVLYELLTGTTPVERVTLTRVGFQEFCHIVSTKDPPRPSNRVSALTAEADARPLATPTSFGSRQLKGELDWIVMKAIARDREQRYTSANEFADDLQRHVDGEAVIACPPSLTYRLSKTAHQNRVALGVLAVIISALSAVAITSRWQISAVELARQETEIREQRAIELLHAFKLRGALTAFREEKLVELYELTAELRTDPLLASSQNRPTHLIDLLSGAARRPAKASFSNPSPIHDLAATCDQKHFVSVDESGEVRLWKMDSPDDIGVRLGSHQEPAHAVAVSPDGQLAVSGSTSGELRYWNLMDHTLMRTLRPVQVGIETLQWSPDGQTVAAGARYSEVWVGDAEGNERFRIPNDHRHESLLFTADSSELIVPNRVDIGVYSVSTGLKIRSISTQPLTNVRTLCFAGENGQWLVAGERFRENLVVLDYTAGKLLGQIPLGLAYPRDISAATNGLWIRVSFSGGQVQVIQLSPANRGMSATGTIWAEFRAQEPAEDSRLPLAFVSGDTEFLSGGADGCIHLWDQRDLPVVEFRNRPDSIVASYLKPESGNIFHVHRSKPHPFLSQAQAFSEQLVDGKFAVALSNKIVLIRASDHRVIAELDSPLSDHREVAIATGGDVLVAGSPTSLCVWKTSDDWIENQMVNRFDINHRAAPIFSDGGGTLIVDDDDADRLLAIDVETQAATKIASVSGVNHLCLDPQERRLGIVFENGFRVIERSTAETILNAENVGRTGQVRFTHDGTILLDGRRDGHIHVWHLTTRRELGLLYRPEFTIGTLVRWQLTHEPPRMMLEFADDYGGTRLMLTPCRRRR